MTEPQNANDPNTKYASQKPTVEETVPESKDPLLFYNYHEFSTSDFKSSQSNSTDTSLVVNHFPNIYVARDSLTYSSTRIVRVPRIFDTIPYSDIIPQFSPYIPGKEPAALTTTTSSSETVKYGPIGLFDGNWFSGVSLTPLVPDLVSAEEYTDLVTRINKDIYEAMDPRGAANVVEGILDFLTAGLYTLTFAKLIGLPYSKSKLMALDEYLETEINSKLFKDRDGLRVIPLRKTGYLSIPRPV